MAGFRRGDARRTSIKICSNVANDVVVPASAHGKRNASKDGKRPQHRRARGYRTDSYVCSSYPKKNLWVSACPGSELSRSSQHVTSKPTRLQAELEVEARGRPLRARAAGLPPCGTAPLPVGAAASVTVTVPVLSARPAGATMKLKWTIVVGPAGCQ